MAPRLAAAATDHLFTALLEEVFDFLAEPHLLTDLAVMPGFALPVAVRAEVEVPRPLVVLGLASFLGSASDAPDAGVALELYLEQGGDLVLGVGDLRVVLLVSDPFNLKVLHKLRNLGLLVGV